MAAAGRTRARHRPRLSAGNRNGHDYRALGERALVGGERQQRAIGRPRGLGANRHHLLRHPASRGHDPDAASCVRVIGEALAVGRPDRLAVLPAVARHLDPFALSERAHVDFVETVFFRRVREAPPIRREGRIGLKARRRGQLDHIGQSQRLGRGRSRPDPTGQREKRARDERQGHAPERRRRRANGRSPHGTCFRRL